MSKHRPHRSSHNPGRSAGGLLALLPGPEDEEGPADVDESDDAARAATDAVFDAMTAGDRRAFREALQHFVQIELFG